MITYFNGHLLPKEEISISPDDRGFLLSDGVYEAICVYDGEPFEMDAHFDRLERSLREIGMLNGGGHVQEAVNQLRDAIPELLRRNALDEQHGKVYFQVTRGVAPRTHAFPKEQVEPTVYATAGPYTPPVEQWQEGVRIILRPDLRWGRCDIKSIALLPNVLANQESQVDDAFETVLVREGFITEGSHTSFLAVFDDTVATHPLTNRILPGVTRDVVLALCRDLGIPVREFPVGASELKDADEVILLGTTTGVMPVTEVDDWTVADGQPGPVTRRLQRAFLDRADLPVSL